MGRFEIEFSKKAAKDYKKLPKNYKSLVNLLLSKMTEGLPVDLKPIIGEKDTYRIRLGKYRILFEIIEKTILISRILPRGDVYK